MNVLDFAGASLAFDSVDVRILDETATGTITFPDGGNGSLNDLIDTQGAVDGLTPKLNINSLVAESLNKTKMPVF